MEVGGAFVFLCRCISYGDASVSSDRYAGIRFRLAGRHSAERLPARFHLQLDLVHDVGVSLLAEHAQRAGAAVLRIPYAALCGRSGLDHWAVRLSGEPAARDSAVARRRAGDTAGDSA